MAFVSLFSSPPNEGLHVADSASNEREKAGEDEADVNCEGIRATTKRKRKRKRNKKNKNKNKNNKWGRNGKIDMSTRTGQQEEQEERCLQRDSSLQLDQEHKPSVQGNEWHWDYNSEDTISQSVNPRKRKQQSNACGDFASELDRYRQMREALPPPHPAFPFPPQQTGGLSQKKEKEMNMQGQENPRKTWIHKINRGMPDPGQRGSAQSGRGRRGMSRGRGSRNNNNNPDGRHCGKGRGLSGGKVEALPQVERKKPFLSKDFIDRHTVEFQGRHVCKYFLRGACIRGDQCNFEHDMNVKKMELCKFYVIGYCTKESCIYMHKEFPCKFFHTGTVCYQGDACRFSHEPLTDLTRELLEQFLNSLRVKKEEADQMEQEDNNDNKDNNDDDDSPLPPSPLPPVAKLTVDLADNVVNVRSNFYNSYPLTECQLQGSSTLPQSRGGVDIQGEKCTIPAGSPGLERRSEMHTCSPAVPDSKMERNLSPAVQDELISSSVEACPGAVTSVLKTLFLHLNPTDEEPQNSGTETGVSASSTGSDEGVNRQPAALTAKKRQTQGTVTTKQETNVCDWLVEAEARSGQCPARSEGELAPLCKPLSAEDREWEVGEEGRLRDEPALMPLEAIPGMARRDPRPAPCAVSVTLPLPTFAHTVEWRTEEPMPLPPQVDGSPQGISPTPHFQNPLVDSPEHSSFSWIPPRNLPQVVSSAVHKLPVPALGGLIHPTYTKVRGVNTEGGESATAETQTKGNVLKGLFKTLLPVSDL